MTKGKMMADVPIRSVTVSDFRRIEGTRVLPFDAPIVLIHGPNGAGKTSVLSALELGLTGRVGSMERQDDRYAAHLPFLGQPYATVRVDVADYLLAGTRGTPITVNGARIDGTPAFSENAARFYAERCYLDQASLGRLLELYQHREGREESALARFVNELLGLEKLDALRTGLHDATDLRLFKNLSAGADDAASKAKAAAGQLTERTAALTEFRTELIDARNATLEAVEALRPGANGTDDPVLLLVAQAVLDEHFTSVETTDLATIHQELIALGGRIAGLADRPAMQRLTEVQTRLNTATVDRATWEAAHGIAIRAWEEAALAAGAELHGDHRDAIRQATTRVERELEAKEALGVQADATRARLDADRIELDRVQARLADANEHSSALVESLATLRTVLQDDVCPVCDRDYTDIGDVSLPEHIDAKLARLTAHGQQLIDLRNERDRIAARVSRSEVEHTRLIARLMPPGEQEALDQLHARLAELARQLDDLEPAIGAGAEIDKHSDALRDALDNLEAASSEDEHVRAELARYAGLLGVNTPPFDDSLRAAWKQLVDRAAAESIRVRDAADNYRTLETQLTRFSTAIEREAEALQLVADSAQQKARWEARVTESKRRQSVAKEVHAAATQARTTVVQRVFTESLNDVWRSVFTRLAPNEGFIPSFGIPTATKTALDIKLVTTHRTGEASGPPQMMLSAGNLNTAALSLFLALNLAVEPAVPCLVFDDPVQAMDEVHVVQFAALIRVLAKQHDRQVVIAVHDRELFDYLTLELSPAYEGDELITIELGDRENDADRGVNRHGWNPDAAIAG